MQLVGNKWDEILEEEYHKDYFKKIVLYINKAYKERPIYPPKSYILRALSLTDYDDVKVVILGQDPYHGTGEANGLAFAVNPGVKLPPSLKNIYKEISEIDENINPNNIFSAQNMQDKELKAIDEIITDYNDKIQETTDELEDLLKEDKIKENITKREISQRKEYYINLYNTIMFSDVMKTQYRNLESEIKTEKSKLTDKVKQIEKTNEFLKKNSDSWTIKNDKIQFTNLIRMTEYYNLLNKLAE